MESQLIHGNCFDLLPNFPDNSFDAIITDPPYKYLNHKLESDWDEWLFFNECLRVLKKDGFLVFFGAKESYFKWNYICCEIGLNFKEQIIWDKARTSNPMCTLPRSHENISIYVKGKKTLNEVRIDKIDYDLIANPSAIVNDFKRLLSSLKLINTWEDFQLFLQGTFNQSSYKSKSEVTLKGAKYAYDRGSQIFISHTKGRKFPSIFRCLNDHYDYLHPTQKPLFLVQKLIELTTDLDNLVLDSFGGSGTTALACLETGRRYVVIEQDQEYFEVAQKRITQWHNEQLNKTGTYELPEGIERVKLDKTGQLSLF